MHIATMVMGCTGGRGVWAGVGWVGGVGSGQVDVWAGKGGTHVRAAACGEHSLEGGCQVSSRGHVKLEGDVGSFQMVA
jgi:hypothetical protein